MNAPEPVNASQLKSSFVGMLNYYHRHLPNLAHTLEPLYSLLHKNVKWKWEEQQHVAFKAAKQILCSATLLVHYDSEKPLILHCDASPYGMGSVLAHTMHDGTERPIAYASRTLLGPWKELFSNWKGRTCCYLFCKEISPVFIWEACYNCDWP